MTVIRLPAGAAMLVLDDETSECLTPFLRRECARARQLGLPLPPRMAELVDLVLGRPYQPRSQSQPWGELGTTKDAARLLGIGTRAVTKRLSSHKRDPLLRGVRDGKCWRVDLDYLKRGLALQENSSVVPQMVPEHTEISVDPLPGGSAA
jgi:hypothetical protein